MMQDTLVMKFGGAAFATTKHFSRIAEIVLARKSQHGRVIVVVSAMENMTDELIELAHQVNPSPPQRELDMLVSVGERISVSLLAMALAKRGGEAISFTGSQAGIITNERHCEAQIIEVRPERLLAPLQEGKVVIVAGFQGVSRKKEITTLGRDGSDTTAVALGVAMGAVRVEFYKDVNGIYDRSPKDDPRAKLFRFLSFSEALAVVGSGCGVLQSRCLELAQKNGLTLVVRSFLDDSVEGTSISGAATAEGLPVYESEVDNVANARCPALAAAMSEGI